MTKILIVFDSRHGHTLDLALKAAEGVKDIAQAEPVTRRVAAPLPDPAEEDMRPEALAEIREASVDDLVEADGIVCGSPTRFGVMTAAMKAFWDDTGPLWATRQLFGKPGAVFTSTSTPHGGNEMTLFSLMVPMMHHGMVIVTPGYGHDVYYRAASPYGATSVSGHDGHRPPTDDDRTAAFFLGRRVAEVATALKGARPVVETR